MNKLIILQALLVLSFGTMQGTKTSCTISPKQSHAYTKKFINTLKQKGVLVAFKATVKHVREIAQILSKNPHLSCLCKQATKTLYITLEQLHWSALAAQVVQDISSDVADIVRNAPNYGVEAATAKLKEYVNEAFGREITKIVMDINDDMESAQELLQKNKLTFLEDFADKIYESPPAMEILLDFAKEDLGKKKDR